MNNKQLIFYSQKKKKKKNHKNKNQRLVGLLILMQYDQFL